MSCVSPLTFVRVTGADAAAFLNGQYTSSTLNLVSGETRIGAFCTPKGRAAAVAYVLALDDGFELWTHNDLLDTLVTTLQRYVMRAKVRFDAAGQHAATRPFALAAPGAVVDLAAPDFATVAVAAGIPTLDAATSGEFVPQMINLDLLGGIDFTKGCYTGQEIVARTHNLGTIKRRMLAYRVQDVTDLRPGEPLVDADGERIGQVVAAAHDTVLAVVRLARRDDAQRAGGVTIEGRKPLPYVIPELAGDD